MLQFHSRAKSLIAIETSESNSVAKLDARAQDLGFTVPAAFREWAAHGLAEICRRYSNDDHFSDVDAEVVTLPDNRRGLSFARENQGNFDLVCLLDGSDDPPVMFGWCGRAPWVQYSESFSDSVFCQIFDWQYMLEFVGAEKQIAYYSDILLNSVRPVDELAKHHAPLPRTTTNIEGISYHSRRIAFSPDARMVTQESDDSCSITVTGKSSDAIVELEDELIAAFGQSVQAPTHSCVLFGLLELDRQIGNGRSLTKLKTLFDVPPDDSILKQLTSFCHSHPLRELRTPDWNNDHESSFTLRISQIGLNITLAKHSDYEWKLETLV